MFKLALADDQSLFRRGMVMLLPEMSDVELLTERLHESFRLICQEVTSTAISGKLFLNPRKLKAICTKSLLKIGAHNMAGILVFAITKGYFTL